MNIDEVLALMQDVPDYQTFLTVDELNASMHQLASQYPQVVELIHIGHSRQGDPIHAMKIGSGRKTGLMFAMPHPNEPIGSLMLEFLSARLAEDDALRETLDYTWYIVKCIDVDGTRLNEGWFKGPFSVSNYARNFFRPAGHLQVEWTFPIDYKTLYFDQPLPETQALMKLMEEVRPDFIFSLHNSGFGGVYAYLTHDIPEYYPDFYRVVESQDLPLHLGEAEVPYAVTYSKAIFAELGIEKAYDFLEENGVPDPATVIKSGGSSTSYANRFGDPLCIVCEMPYFYNPAIHNTSPSDMLRRDAVLEGLQKSKADGEFFRQQYDRVKDFLTIQSPFRDTMEDRISSNDEYLASQENWARNDPVLNVPATVAEKFDNLLVRRFYNLLSIGMFVRMIQAEMDASGQKSALVDALQATQKWFDEESSALEKELAYDVVPIQKLVRVQLGAGLLYASLVK